jgi:hypothetical protein
MSEKLLVQRAQHEYAQFISGLNPCPAYNVALGGRDQVAAPSHLVSRGEMLSAFLATRPEFACQRAALADVNLEQGQFPVETARWNSLTTRRD